MFKWLSDSMVRLWEAARSGRDERLRWSRTFRSRSPGDRRRRERRLSPLPARLASGLWLQYHRATYCGRADPVSLDQASRMLVHDALIPEADRYLYRDRKSGEILPVSFALEAAIFAVWRSLGDGGADTVGAATMVDAVAEALCSRFQVLVRDRRVGERRAADALVESYGFHLADAAMVVGGVVGVAGFFAESMSAWVADRLTQAFAAVIGLQPSAASIRIGFGCTAVVLFAAAVLRRFGRQRAR
ncbi:MAG: hypothetical protein R2729_29255 [Bryobacteraceae bacterium]